jgi:murein DD-endopeptidase MepM/ murein hydrolase activator NlpD
MHEKNKTKIKKRKFRLSIFDDHTLEELRSLRLSKPVMFSIAGGGVFLFAFLIFILIAYTPLNRLVPERYGYEIKNKAIKNSLTIDSLEKLIKSEDIYLSNLKSIIEGKLPSDSFNINSLYNDTSVTANFSDFNNSNLDSIIKAELEDIETGSLNNQNDKIKETLANLHFIIPLKGTVSNEFKSDKSHFGIDIVPGNDETVLATLSGTVILSTWSVETGYVIGIQHNWNLVSFYKHNSVLLKKTGDRVKTAEPIALVGNSGEQTTGTHLHFELWYNGTPTNPRDYITF